MKSGPVIVIGDGWAALGSVGLLISTGVEVHWVSGSGSRMFPPLACIEDGPGVWIWQELAEKLKVSSGFPQNGSFLREYRNKAFREPMWAKVPSLESRNDTGKEVLWAPEQKFVGSCNRRFDLTLGELDEEFRKILIPQNYSKLKKTEGIPVTGIKTDQGAAVGVLLGSGDVIDAQQVVYADRWSLLHAMEGIPKPIHFLRKREPMGVLQVSFVHESSIALGTLESFFASLHREGGKEIERRVWGYFSTDGKKSFWTLCLSPEEVEDNHEIAKKLRRLKGTLDKIFSAPPFLLPNYSTFISSVIDEQFRFEEEAFYADSLIVKEPLDHPDLSGIQFLCDGYGPSSSFCQVGAMLGIQVKARESDSEAESMNTLRTGTL